MRFLTDIPEEFDIRFLKVELLCKFVGCTSLSATQFGSNTTHNFCVIAYVLSVHFHTNFS